MAAHRKQTRDLYEQHAPVGVRARGGLEERSRHGRVPARLAHQHQPQVVEMILEVQPALLHRVSGHDAQA
jgi:hypothetical protein